MSRTVKNVSSKKAKNKAAREGQKQAARRKRNYIMVASLVLVAAAMLIATLQFGSNKGSGQKPQTSPNTASSGQETRDYTIKTAKGNIVIAVYPGLMPHTVANFAKLVNTHFYDGLDFWRVQDWLIQGGDPEGNGKGGPGWTIPFETNPALKNVRGAVGMARGPALDSAGSQFYILRKDEPGLDGRYAIFGKVIRGMAVVDRIVAGDKMISVRPGSD